MSISVRVRFEVFNRDRFTCAYCGHHPPDVLLEVDHVVPRAAGGSDDLDNLITACWNCNRGKGARLLEEGGRPAVSRQTVKALEERLSQAKAYVELLTQLSNFTDAMLNTVTEAWAKAFSAHLEERNDGTVYVLDGGRWPKPATLRIFFRELDLEAILSAIDITASRIGANDGNDRYFYAVCWRMIRDKRGEPTPSESDEMVALRAQNGQLREQIAEQEEVLDDLRLNVRLLREAAGRA